MHFVCDESFQIRVVTVAIARKCEYNLSTGGLQCSHLSPVLAILPYITGTAGNAGSSTVGAGYAQPDSRYPLILMRTTINAFKRDD